jgi:glucose-1-phosphate cytidylyltransferase
MKNNPNLSERIKVVILCGGAGTRLREETEYRPKPMVNIGPRPILWHIMKYYSRFNCKDFILALGYKGEMIKNYFCHYELMNNDVTIELGQPEKTHIHYAHDEVGWKVTLSDTGENTLKGGRLKKIEKYITDDIFMMTYGDGIADVDINALLKFHKSHGKIATVTGINPASRFGELKIKGTRVETFREKSPISNSFVNGGFFVFHRRIFDYLTSSDSCDLEIGPLEQLAAEGQLMVYKHRGFWACMDTLRDMEYLNQIWNSGKAKWKIW